MRATKPDVQNFRSRTQSMRWQSEDRARSNLMGGCLYPFGRQKTQAQQLQRDRLKANRSAQKPQWPRRREGFIRGYEPTLRLYRSFYGDEDSDDPELEPGQGAVGRRRGANPLPMPVPFSHRANKIVLERYGYAFNHYCRDGRSRKANS